MFTKALQINLENLTCPLSSFFSYIRDTHTHTHARMFIIHLPSSVQMCGLGACWVRPRVIFTSVCTSSRFIESQINPVLALFARGHCAGMINTHFYFNGQLMSILVRSK